MTFTSYTTELSICSPGWRAEGRKTPGWPIVELAAAGAGLSSKWGQRGTDQNSPPCSSPQSENVSEGQSVGSRASLPEIKTSSKGSERSGQKGLVSPASVTSDDCTHLEASQFPPQSEIDTTVCENALICFVFFSFAIIFLESYFKDLKCCCLFETKVARCWQRWQSR